jgi:hypothetical protein
MLVSALAVVLITALGLAVFMSRRNASREVFEGFCAAIRDGDYRRAQGYCAPGILGRGDSGNWVVHMVNGDKPAASFGRAQVSEVRRSLSRDIVVFKGGSIGDEAHIEDGVITHVKCP